MKNNPFNVPEYELNKITESELMDGIKEVDNALAYIEKLHLEIQMLEKKLEIKGIRITQLQNAVSHLKSKSK